MSPAEAKKFLADNNIKFILAQFVDIHGSAKAKAVPADHLDMVLTDGAGFAGFALWGFGMGPHGPDYMAVGDLSTLHIIPWMPGFARLTTYGHVHGKPYPYDTRYALKVQLDKLAQKGMTLYTGIEPEFIVLRKDADGRIAPFDATDTLEKPCYDYKGLARGAQFLERLVDALSNRLAWMSIRSIMRMRTASSKSTTRMAMRSLPPIASSSSRWRPREIAHQMGLIATFMPKPFSNRTGTGAHFHLSDRRRSNAQSVPRRPRQTRFGIVEDGIPVPRWPAGTCARTRCAVCAVD